MKKLILHKDNDYSAERCIGKKRFVSVEKISKIAKVCDNVFGGKIKL